MQKHEYKKHLDNFDIKNKNMLYNKIQLVKKILNEASQATDKFCKLSGLKGIQGCHACCLKNDIMASPLEFLPLAYDLCRKGIADKVYDRMGKLKENVPCFFLSLTNKEGGCTQYENRGLICRLFGFSSNTDKENNPRLITCKKIKDTQTYRNLTAAIIKKSPEFRDFYIQFEAIDFFMAGEQLQINDAIRRAIEIVLNYESLQHYKFTA